MDNKSKLNLNLEVLRKLEAVHTQSINGGAGPINSPCTNCNCQPQHTTSTGN